MIMSTLTSSTRTPILFNKGVRVDYLNIPPNPKGIILSLASRVGITWLPKAQWYLSVSWRIAPQHRSRVWSRIRFRGRLQKGWI